VLARYLPTTPIFRQLVSQTASGVESVATQEAAQNARLGRTGVAISNLCPGGKARFDDDLIDVVTRGELVEKGRSVRIIGHSAAAAVVEATEG
jgi:membrane-bound ClpP family serine protease